jgi:hypothetical protein
VLHEYCSFQDRVMRTVAIILLLSAAACSREADTQAPTRTTFVISGPEAEVKQPVDVRSFAVVPQALRPGQPATVQIELEAPRPRQQIAVDWYGPDGWLVAYQVHDAAEVHISFPAPAPSFDQRGRYRVVVRSGLTTLAESGVVVSAGK